VANILGNDNIAAVLKDGKILIKEGKVSLASIVEESGHAIFSVLTDKEKQSLINEIKKEYPIIEDIIDEIPQYEGVYGDKYNDYAEELIMKQLVDYAKYLDSKGKLEKPKTITQRIANFFDMIFDRIKSFLKFGSEINTFNKKVLNGELAKRTEAEFKDKDALIKLLQENGLGQSDIFGKKVVPVPKKQGVLEFKREVPKFGQARPMTEGEKIEQEKAQKQILPGQLSMSELIKQIQEASTTSEKYQIIEDYYIRELAWKMSEIDGYSIGEDYLRDGYKRITSVGEKSTQYIMNTIKRASNGRAIYNGDRSWSIPDDTVRNFAKEMGYTIDNIFEPQAKMRIEENEPVKKEEQKPEDKYREWLRNQPGALADIEKYKANLDSIPNKENRAKEAAKYKREFDNKWINEYSLQLKKEKVEVPETKPAEKFSNLISTVQGKVKEKVKNVEDIQALPGVFQWSRRHEKNMNSLWGFLPDKVSGINKVFDLEKIDPVEVGIFDEDFSYTLPSGVTSYIKKGVPYVISGHNTLQVMKDNIEKFNGKALDYIHVTNYSGNELGIEKAIEDSIDTNIRYGTLDDIEKIDMAVNGIMSDAKIDVAEKYITYKANRIKGIASIFKNAGLVDFWNQFVASRLSDFRKLAPEVMNERLNFLAVVGKNMVKINADTTQIVRDAVNSQLAQMMTEYLEPSGDLTIKDVETAINKTLRQAISGNLSPTETMSLFGDTIIKMRHGVDKNELMLKLIKSELKSSLVSEDDKKALAKLQSDIMGNNPDVISLIQENAGNTKTAKATVDTLRRMLLTMRKNGLVSSDTELQEATQEIDGKKPTPEEIQKYQVESSKNYDRQIKELKRENLNDKRRISELEVLIARNANAKDTQIARFFDAGRKLDLYRLKSSILRRHEKIAIYEKQRADIALIRAQAKKNEAEIRIRLNEQKKKAVDLANARTEAQKQKAKDRKEALKSIIDFIKEVPDTFKPDRGSVYDKLIKRIQNVSDKDDVYALMEMANQVYESARKQRYIAMIKDLIVRINGKKGELEKKIDIKNIQIINELVGDIDFSDVKGKLIKRLEKIQKNIVKVLKTKHRLSGTETEKKLILPGRDIENISAIYKEIESLKKKDIRDITNEELLNLNQDLKPYYAYMGMKDDTDEQLYKSLSPTATKASEFMRIQKYIDTETAAGRDVTIPKEILDSLEALKRKPISSLTADELLELHDRIKILEKIGRLKVKSRKESLKLQAQTLREELLSSGMNQKGALHNLDNRIREVEINGGIGKFDKVANFLKAGTDFVIKTYRGYMPQDVIFNLLDNNRTNYDGPWMTKFKGRINAAFNNFMNLSDNYIDPITKEIKRLNLKETNLKNIGVWAILQQEGGRGRMLNEYTEAQIKRFEEKGLTNDEMYVYNLMRDKLEEMGDVVSGVLHDVYNIDLKREHNYFPFLMDFNKMAELGVHIEERFGNYTGGEDLLLGADVTEHKGRVKSPSKTFAMERKGNIGQIEKVNALDVFTEHMQNAAYLAAFGKTLKVLNMAVTGQNTVDNRQKVDGEIQKVDGVPSIRNNPMIDYLGSDMYRHVVNYLELVARKGGIQGESSIKLLNKIRSNLSAAVLALKLSTIMLQPMAVLNGTSLIGAKYTADGISKMTTSKDWREFLYKNSPIFRHRIGDDPILEERASFSAMKKFQDFGYKGIKATDAWAAGAVMIGAYNRYMSEHNLDVDLSKPNADAMAYAERIMGQTQASAYFIDQPAAFTMSQNRWAVKTVFQFQMFRLASLFRMAAYDIPMDIKNRRYGNALRKTLWMLIANLMVLLAGNLSKDLWDLLLGLEDPQPDKYSADVLMNSMIFDLATSAPFASNVGSMIKYKRTGIPVIDPIVNLSTAISEYSAAKKPTTKYKKIVKIISAVASLGGVPGTQQASTLANTALTDWSNEIAAEEKEAKQAEKTAYMSPFEKYKSTLKAAKSNTKTYKYKKLSEQLRKRKINYKKYQELYKKIQESKIPT
jgi:hypothetical protein